MTEVWRPPSLSPRRYRWLDRSTKLLGVALIAAGLHVGGATPLGLALAVVGAGLGLLTITIDRP
ncbi:MAG: hypothetical protein ACLFM8_08285 [Halobacteriales archaeon]